MAGKRLTKSAKAENALRKYARKKHLGKKATNNLIFGVLNKVGLRRGSKMTKRGKSPAHRRRR